MPGRGRGDPGGQRRGGHRQGPGLASLLGDPDELGRLALLAEAALRESAVWARVTALADALEAAGQVEAGIREHLPAADPRWPPAPA